MGITELNSLKSMQIINILYLPNTYTPFNSSYTTKPSNKDNSMKIIANRCTEHLVYSFIARAAKVVNRAAKLNSQS